MHSACQTSLISTYRKGIVDFLAVIAFYLGPLLLGTFATAQTLPRYSCLHREYDTQRWTEHYDRSFDSAGVLLQKGAYHPLSIAFYGIMNYEDFLKNHDSLSKQRVYDQFQYFTNETHLVPSKDGHGMGLPYRFNFKDLKAPWYSGMTQGVAISFLLRYYMLSQDAKALDIARKLAHFMLQDAKVGGTIGKTSEGFTWIEEYPNSKHSPQVLNGFINGLIGLYEYLQFFPEDTMARRIHDEAYEGLICTLARYDTPNWTNYSRKVSPIPKQYLRYQIAQFDHLHEIYGDPVLIRQMHIWSSFAIGKRDTALKFYRNHDYDFACRMIGEDSVEYWNEAKFYQTGYEGLQECRTGSKQRKTPFPIPWKSRKPLTLSLPTPTRSMELEMDTLPGAQEIGLTALDHKGNTLALTTTREGRFLRLHSCEPVSTLVMQTPKSDLKVICIRSLKVFDADNGKLPKFVVGTLPQSYELKMGNRCSISFEGENLCGLTLYYQYFRDTGPKFEQPTWMADRFISDPNGIFVAPESGTYRFMYAFPYTHPQPRVGTFRLEVK